jgi:hypothetical protein
MMQYNVACSGHTCHSTRYMENAISIVCNANDLSFEGQNSCLPAGFHKTWNGSFCSLQPSSLQACDASSEATQGATSGAVQGSGKSSSGQHKLFSEWPVSIGALSASVKTELIIKL